MFGELISYRVSRLIFSQSVHLLRPEADLMLADLTECVRTGALAAIITHPFISSLLCAFLSCGHFQQLRPPLWRKHTVRYTHTALFSFAEIMLLCSRTVTQRWAFSACAPTHWVVPLIGDVSKIWKPQTPECNICITYLLPFRIY